METTNEKQVNAQLSLFAALQTKRPPRQTTLEDIHSMITSGSEIRNNTEKYRYFASRGFTKDADDIKRRSSPAFSVAATFFDKRQMEYLTEWTNLSLVDYDDITTDRIEAALKLLRNDPYWVLLYTTLSGRGLRIIYRVEGVTDKRTYALAYLQGNEHYSRLLNFKPDTHVKDATRLSAICHDPNACLRLDAQPYPVNYQPRGSTSSDKLMQKKENMRISLNNIIPVVIAELQDRGIVYEPGHHNEYISQAGYLMNRYGITEKDTVAWAVLTFADYGTDQVRSIIHSCYQKAEEHGILKLPNKQKKPVRRRWATPKEISDFISKQADFRHNVISGRTEIYWLAEIDGEPHKAKKWVPLEDRDIATLWVRMSSNEVRVTENNINSVIQSDFTPLFNPFQVYVDSLPEWDGKTDYIAELAAHIHIKNDEGRFVECFRKWLVGILPAIFIPDIVNHQILVFIGRQGNYKSTFFHYLLPAELRTYFNPNMNVERMNKDDRIALSQYALVCFEEIDYMRPSELNQLKALITMREINERRAYAHHKEYRPHIASFCGTGNNIQFLSDPTGNRRWLPFEVENIDSPMKNPFNYTGIYSQAYALWKSGFHYWFSQEEIIEINKHNTYFEIPNLEEELVLTYYRCPLPGEICKFVSTANILERINNSIRHTLSITKISIAMKKLGFEVARTNNLRGYLVVERSVDEVRHSQESTARFICEPLSLSEEEDKKEPELPF